MWPAIGGAALAAWFAATAHAAAPAPSCFPANSKTIATSKNARVFETRRGVYGCLYRYGRARRLDPDSPKLELERTAMKPFRLAGPYVAYAEEVSQGCGPDVCFWTEIVVADLRPANPLIRSRNYAASDETLGPFQRNEDDALNAEGFVTDLALTPTGRVAWIECEGYTAGPCEPGAAEKRKTSVFSARPGTRNRTRLDHGAGVALRSLSWEGRAFRWRKDGRLRSAGYPTAVRARIS